MYTYSRMYTKIKYLPTVVVQVASDGQGVMKDVRRYKKCTRTVKCT